MFQSQPRTFTFDLEQMGRIQEKEETREDRGKKAEGQRDIAVALGRLCRTRQRAKRNFLSLSLSVSSSSFLVDLYDRDIKEQRICFCDSARKCLSLGLSGETNDYPK